MESSFTEKVKKGRGRPRKSSSHKKRHRRMYLLNIKLKKIENGTYRPQGRPKTITISTISTN